MATGTQTPADDISTGDVCIANISPAQRRLRLRFGIASLAFGLALLAALMLLGAGRWWRLTMFLPLIGAATGYFQYSEKT